MQQRHKKDEKIYTTETLLVLHMNLHRFPEIKPGFLNISLFCHSRVNMQLLHGRYIAYTSLKSMQMSMARCLRDSIQLATAACVKEQRSIVYLKTVLINRHDGERAPQNLYYDYWA